jgi:hypothetical protein
MYGLHAYPMRVPELCTTFDAESCMLPLDDVSTTAPQQNAGPPLHDGVESLSTGVTDLATMLVAARATNKGARGLMTIIEETGRRSWQ